MEQDNGHLTCIWNKRQFHIHIICSIRKGPMALWFYCNRVLYNKPSFCFLKYIVCIELYYMSSCMLLWMSRGNDTNIDSTSIWHNDILLVLLWISHILSSKSCKIHGHKQIVLIPHSQDTQDRALLWWLGLCDHWTLLLILVPELSYPNLLRNSYCGCFWYSNYNGLRARLYK